MNKKELFDGIENILFGQRIEGRVVAVLGTSKKGSMYIIETREGLQEVYVPVFATDIFHIAYPIYQPEQVRGQEISVFSRNVRPWVDGQRV